MEAPSGSPSETPLHPVRLVSARTGLSQHVLRVWERRYAAVRPTRSAGGQRLYSDADLVRLQLLRDAIQPGRSIGQLVDLSNDALRELIERDAQQGEVTSTVARASAPASHPDARRVLDASLDAVGRLDPDDLAIELQRAAVQMPFVAFAESVATPLLHEIGARWKRGELGPAQEHVASAVLRRVLSEIVHRCVPRPDAPALIVGTPMGERHELGALMVAACAAACGWRVTYWGADLPADQIARTARELQADVVALSIVCSTSDARLRADLDALLGELPPHCQVILGGASAVPYARQLALLGAVRFESLSALDRFLTDRAAPP